MDKDPCYNITICTKLIGKIFKNYLETKRKDKKYLMCSIDACGKEYVSMHDDSNSGCGRPMQNTPSKKNFSHLLTQSTLSKFGFNVW